jgi:hypothetical protein
VSWFKPSDGSAQGLQAFFTRLRPRMLRVLNKTVWFICAARLALAMCLHFGLVHCTYPHAHSKCILNHCASILSNCRGTPAHCSCALAHCACTLANYACTLLYLLPIQKKKLIDIENPKIYSPIVHVLLFIVHALLFIVIVLLLLVHAFLLIELASMLIVHAFLLIV